MKPSALTVMIVAIALVLAAPNRAAKEGQSGQTLQGSPTLAGAGSTFIAPLTEQWIEDYHDLHPEVSIDYNAVGSGEGVDRFVAGTVDFAARDGGMSDVQIAKVDRGVRFVPAAIGGVVLAYNIKGVTGGLKLTREVYADIFLGKVRT